MYKYEIFGYFAVITQDVYHCNAIGNYNLRDVTSVTVTSVT